MLVIVVRCTKRDFRRSVLRIRRQNAMSCIAQNLNHRSIAGACSCKSPSPWRATLLGRNPK
jgi:hypothetical protein